MCYRKREDTSYTIIMVYGAIGLDFKRGLVFCGDSIKKIKGLRAQNLQMKQKIKKKKKSFKMQNYSRELFFLKQRTLGCNGLTCFLMNSILFSFS